MERAQMDIVVGPNGMGRIGMEPNKNCHSIPKNDTSTVRKSTILFSQFAAITVSTSKLIMMESSRIEIPRIRAGHLTDDVILENVLSL